MGPTFFTMPLTALQYGHRTTLRHAALMALQRLMRAKLSRIGALNRRR
jgi:hypothetical protein